MTYRFLLPAALASFTAIGWFVRHEGREPEMVSAREVLTLAQGVSHANYTFDRETASALEASQVARPQAGADVAELEELLRSAGFRLKPLGKANVFLVERGS